MTIGRAQPGAEADRRRARHRSRPFWTAGHVAVLIVSVPVALVTGWLVWRGNPAGQALAAGFNAVIGVGGGFLITMDPTGPAADRRFRRLIGLAVMFPALNQGLSLTPLGTPLVGSLAAVTAGVLASAGVLQRFARAEAWSALRSLTEALAVGLSLTCVSWAAAFRAVSDPADLVPKLLTSALVIGVSLTMVIRSRSVALAMTAAGAMGVILVSFIGRWLTLADVVDFDAYALLLPAQTPFWALIIVGLLWSTRRPPEGRIAGLAGVERRAQLILASIISVSLFAVLLHTARHLRVDAITWWLLAGTVLAVWAREVVRTMQSHQLLLRLNGLARTDGLTGLPNLRSLHYRLREISRLGCGRVTTMTLDVNRFRDVNDILGHSLGDDLLAVLGGELAGLGERAEAFRVGGDEFVVVGLDRDIAELTEQVSQLVARASAAVPETTRLELTSSLGVDLVTLRADTTAEDLHASVARSGHAMRKAKHDRVPVAMYDDAMSRAHARRLRVEHRLREGLAAVEVYFQPIVSLSQGRVVGAEALARWTDSTVGVVSPEEFVVAAEDTGVIDALGRHVLRRALQGAVASGLIAAGHSLAVNVSALQLRQQVFLPGFLRELRSAGVPPQQVTIEVTESILVQPDDPAVATLAQAQRAGVRIALDDFGTGYSSLSYLTRLPVQSIKIDRSLTRRIGEDKADAIATSIIELARQLDLEIVVEGVETVEQEKWAKGHGLDRLQGWLYSPAVDRADLAAMLNRQRRVVTT